MMTASNAVCSECGAAVADERAEELITPTPLAGSMLKDGAWLISRMRASLAGLGVPDAEIATRPAMNDADALMEAYSQVEDEEDEHLYHTKGWCRELWIKSLGMHAILPPPEEVEHVKTAKQAAEAEERGERAR